MSTSSDEEFFDCSSEPVKYYAVACQRNKGTGLVTTDINEARKQIKIFKGSRFNSFYDPVEARRFSQNYLADDNEITKEKKTKLPQVDPDPFPNVTSINLNMFKDAIEKGDLNRCEELIWNNPRHLVTASDFPPLLRASRFHYNALHVATMSNQHRILLLILESLSRKDFWHSLHPTADDHCNQERRHRVIDMYLNTPESCNHETPLHFASKFGYNECLRTLLRNDLMDTSLTNLYGHRAEDIICTRYEGSDKESRITEMRAIFSEKYVVLLGGEKVQILDPISHCQLLGLLRLCNDDYRDLRRDFPLGETGLVRAPIDGVVRAYAGPLPEDTARKFRNRWAVLNAEDALKFEQIRRQDSEKGLEIHGRYLALLFGAPWKELWTILKCYTDLGVDEGRQILEESLAAIETSPTSADDDISQTEPEVERSRLHSAYDSLVRLFGRLSLGSSMKAATRTPPVSPVRPAGEAFRTPTRLRPPVAASTPMQHASVVSLRSTRTIFNTSLLGGGMLTPTDRQVRRALLHASRGPLDAYPLVSSWLADLSVVDPLGDAEASNGLITSTPLKKRPLGRHAPLLSSHCLSPLSQIELPD